MGYITPEAMAERMFSQCMAVHCITTLHHCMLVRSLESSLATFLPPTSFCSRTFPMAWELSLRPKCAKCEKGLRRPVLLLLIGVNEHTSCINLQCTSFVSRRICMKRKIEIKIFLAPSLTSSGRFLWLAGFRFWATAPTARLERAMMQTSTNAPPVIWDGTHLSFLATILRQRPDD